MDDLLWERMKKLIREQAPESPPERPLDPNEIRETLELARRVLESDERRTTVQDGEIE